MFLFVDDNAGVLFITLEVPIEAVRGVKFGHVYHSYEFEVHPDALYDARTNLYPDSQAMWENMNIKTSDSPIYIQFHDPDVYDQIPLNYDEIGLALSNFNFRKVYIKNETGDDITVRLVLTSKNEYSTP